jgi:hypothetical protein
MKGVIPFSQYSNMNDVTEVTPNLFVTSKSAINDATIKGLGITMIINSAKELDNYEPASKDLSLIYVKVPVHDHSDAPIYPYFMVRIFKKPQHREKDQKLLQLIPNKV